MTCECMTQEDAINMSNEQAILILKPFMEAMRDQYGCPISDAYFAIEKAINSLKEPHWIACSERLPEWNTRVLFYLEKECYYDYPEPQYVTDWWIQEGLFNDKYGAYVYDSPDIGKGIPKDYVVAWMPLPKPWEGDK